MSDIHKDKKSGMSRRAIRESVFKLLYMAEFHPEEEMKTQQDLFFSGIGSDFSEETADGLPGPEDRETVSAKYGGVRENIPEIDALLNRTSEGWKTSRMSKVDLSILRLAVFELLYDETIPVGVAINEAVEIAKKFGGEASGSFVNGILGKIASMKKE